MSIIQLAEDLGMKVERRPVAVEELESFEEAGACGTAAVISPIGEINDIDSGKVYRFCKDGKPGPKSTKLYETLVGIQYGELEDKHNWVTIVE
jgi:branched-chain amino acid aminotransferase